MAVSPSFAADLGVEMRRLYEGTELRIMELLRRAAERLLARPHQAARITAAFQRAIRDEVARLRRDGRRLMGDAVTEAWARGDAAAVADLRGAGATVEEPGL